MRPALALHDESLGEHDLRMDLGLRDRIADRLQLEFDAPPMAARECVVRQVTSKRAGPVPRGRRSC